MAKPEANELEGTSEPFKCKTCVLRVSIHCEGCKRKVIKILHSIHGVHAVEIDRMQQKVTVTTNTDEQTLIKKLIKAGKHAEPWPQQKPISINIKENQIAAEIPAGETIAAVHDGGKQKQNTETEPPEKEVQVPSKNEEKCGLNGNAQVLEVSKGGDGRGDATESGGGAAERVVESPPEEGGDKSIAGEIQPGGPSGAVVVESSCSGSGEGRKKKKKTGQRKEKSGGVVAGNVVSPESVPAPASKGSVTTVDHHHDQTPSSYHSPPLNQPYHNPVHTVTSQPAYVASYNTAHASSTYDTYYAAPPPNSYAYVHSVAPPSNSYAYYAHSVAPINVTPPPSSYAYVHSIAPTNVAPSSPPSSPFDFFSDENPSGCSVM